MLLAFHCPLLVALFLLLARAECFSPATWMKDYRHALANKTLLDLTLPGTHDSASFYISNQTAGEGPVYNELLNLLKFVSKKLGIPIEVIIKRWSKSQTNNFSDQLKLGVRYIDLRAFFYDSTWYSHHSVALGTPLSNLLAQIAAFLQANRDEIVLIEVSHTMYDRGTEQHYDELAALFLDRGGLGAMLYNASAHALSTFTYAQAVARNERVFVIFPAYAPPSPIFLNRLALWNTFADTPALHTMFERNLRFIADYRLGYYLYPLFKLSYTLTADLWTILASIFDRRAPQTLLELIAEANPQLHTFYYQLVQHSQRAKTQLGNVLIIDNIEKSMNVDFIAICLNSSNIK